MAHLVAGQAAVVRYEQSGLDSQVTETLHELLPRLGSLGAVQDLLQKEG